MVNTKLYGSADYVFQQLARGLPDDIRDNINRRRVDAREWFRQAAYNITSVSAQRFMNNASSNRTETNISYDNIGEMFMFWYDAKLKADLPYWDRLPLVFPIEIYSDGFLGINLHYLPPVYRANLMDALYNIANNNNFDDKKKLILSYQTLKGAKKFRSFKPCVKRYLNDHVQSRFVKISATEWDMALMLPTERFQKASKQRVWDSSVNSIRRSK